MCFHDTVDNAQMERHGCLQEVFEDFVEDTYKSAYFFALSLSGNWSDACDLTQQAFLLAQTHGHQLRDISKRKQWLFTILRREHLRKHRKDGAHPHSTLEFCEKELPQIRFDHTAYLDGKDVLFVLRTLPEDFRMPLVLFYLDQLSYKEIAGVLHLPIGTVMSRLARGKNLLRQELEFPTDLLDES